MRRFTIRPTRWWDWINPFFWRRARRVEAFMEWQWKQIDGDKRMDEAIRNAYLYGTGLPPDAFK